jgi:hypothetical protein
MDLSCRNDSRGRLVIHTIAIEEAQRLIQPLLAPPFPAEAWTQSGAGQVAPNLLCHVVANKREAPARMADPLSNVIDAQRGKDPELLLF